MMEKLVTKKNVLWISGFVTVVLFILDQIGTFRLCGSVEYGRCMDTLYDVLIVFLPTLPLFLFSLITYWMQDEIYRAWFRFARWWIPLSMLLIFLAPDYSGDWLFPTDKGRIAFLVSLLFVVISIVLIAYRFYTMRKKSS